VVTGTNFPAGATVQLQANGVLIGTAAVANNGRFRVLLQTDETAAEGYYVVVASLSQMPSIAHAMYGIAARAERRNPPDEDLQLLTVPAAVPAHQFPPIVYLPLILRQ
jgi:hypothetical protein